MDEMKTEAQLSPGQAFGPYEVIRLLGRGGMGEVYEVQHRRLESNYAIKVFHREIVKDLPALERIRRETIKVCGLRHPDIVKTDCFDQVDDQYYLRMELVEGVVAERGRAVTLNDYVLAKGGLLSPEEARRRVEDILSGLAYAHGRGMVHGDLKPANVLLSEDGANLVDFGLMRVMGTEWLQSWIQRSVNERREAVREGNQESMACARAFAETFDYLSPEVREGAEADTRNDVFAVGAMAHWLLTGEKRAGQRSPSQIVEGLDPEWDELVARATEHHPENRFANAQEMLSALETGVTRGRRYKRATRSRRRRKTALAKSWMLATTVVALGLFMGSVYYYEEVAPPQTEVAESRYQAEMKRMEEKVKAEMPLKSLPEDQERRMPLIQDLQESDRRPSEQPPQAVRENPRRVGEGEQPADPATASRDNPWENSLGMRFVPVPGTKVLFCIWETRVRDFEAFVQSTGYDATLGMYSLRSEGWKQRGDNWRGPGFNQGPTHPVVGVSWEDARAFCRWLTQKERTDGRLGADQEYRLPSDLEWSAAIGLKGENGLTPKDRNAKIRGVFPWGNQWPPPVGAGNYAGEEYKTSDSPSNFNPIYGYRDGYARTSPVGSFRANQHGVFDLGGNVWEWCEEWYDSEQKQTVLRGGSWNVCPPEALLSSFRGYAAPTSRIGDMGFRVVLANGTLP